MPITIWRLKKTGMTPVTAKQPLGHLERLGMVKELTARMRNRLFSHAGDIEIMGRGTEPPADSPMPAENTPHPAETHFSVDSHVGDPVGKFRGVPVPCAVDPTYLKYTTECLDRGPW